LRKIKISQIRRGSSLLNIFHKINIYTDWDKLIFVSIDFLSKIIKSSVNSCLYICKSLGDNNMKKSYGYICSTFVLLTVLLSACAPVSPSIPSAVPTMKASTETPIPTNTPLPSKTPIPPTPTVTPPPLISDFLTNPKVMVIDNLDNLLNWDIWNSGTGNISSGMFELTGQAGYESGLVYGDRIGEGDGILLRYKTLNNKDYKSEFVLASGEWQTESFRQFGIYNGKIPKADLMQGNNWIGGNNLHGNLVLKADTWYNLLVAIGKDGELLAVIWNPDDPSQKSVYVENLGKKWEGLNFEFQSKADKGETMYIDDFMLIKFDEIK
jgi:hypothetical protein